MLWQRLMVLAGAITLGVLLSLSLGCCCGPVSGLRNRLTCIGND